MKILKTLFYITIIVYVIMYLDDGSFSVGEKTSTGNTAYSYTHTAKNELPAKSKETLSFSNPLHSYYSISSQYGYRINPVTGNNSFHKGIDLACNKGTPIYASASGKIISKAYNSIYGNYIIISHDDKYKTRYAHMENFGNYMPGDYVTSSTVIGYAGSTGQSTGPHCHFEIIHDDTLLNPCSKIHF